MLYGDEIMIDGDEICVYEDKDCWVKVSLLLGKTVGYCCSSTLFFQARRPIVDEYQILIDKLFE
jgi:hypothetical protein